MSFKLIVAALVATVVFAIIASLVDAYQKHKKKTQPRVRVREPRRRAGSTGSAGDRDRQGTPGNGKYREYNGVPATDWYGGRYEDPGGRYGYGDDEPVSRPSPSFSSGSLGGGTWSGGSFGGSDSGGGGDCGGD